MVAVAECVAVAVSALSSELQTVNKKLCEAKEVTKNSIRFVRLTKVIDNGLHNAKSKYLPTVEKPDIVKRCLKDVALIHESRAASDNGLVSIQRAFEGNYVPTLLPLYMTTHYV